MPVSLRTDIEINAALNFVDTHDSSPGTNKLYLAIGRDLAWSNEASPPTPTNNTDNDIEFWDKMIGMVVVSPTDTVFVVPNSVWKTDTQYSVYDTSSTTGYEGSFYIKNLNHEVYQCVGVPAGSQLSTVEPQGDNGGVAQLLADGYTWKYLYTVSSADYADMMEDEDSAWLVVNHGDNEDTTDTYRATNAAGVGNSLFILGATAVMIRAKLKDKLNGGLDDVGVVYRQVAIIRNPLATDGTSILTAPTVEKADATLNSGQMLYLENRFATARAIGQSETVKVVINF
jgi:hypothetical protein